MSEGGGAGEGRGLRPSRVWSLPGDCGVDLRTASCRDTRCLGPAEALGRRGPRCAPPPHVGERLAM